MYFASFSWRPFKLCHAAFCPQFCFISCIELYMFYFVLFTFVICLNCNFLLFLAFSNGYCHLFFSYFCILLKLNFVLFSLCPFWMMWFAFCFFLHFGLFIFVFCLICIFFLLFIAFSNRVCHFPPLFMHFAKVAFYNLIIMM